MLGFYHFALFLFSTISLLRGASAQQYSGDVIPNTLPTVPGSEIASFRVEDSSNKNNNLTLINYYSHQLSGQRVAESQVQRAVVIIHGLGQVSRYVLIV